MVSFLRRNPRLLVIQAVLVAISMAVLLWRVDVVEALRRLDNVEPGWALAGMALFTVSKGIHAYRWRVLLGRSDVPLRPLVSIFMVSNLVNALLPLRAGDLVRIELPSRLLGLPRAALASNVLFVESLFDGLAFLVLVAVAGFVLDEGVRELPGLTIFAIIVALAFVVLVLLARWELPGRTVAIEAPGGRARRRTRARGTAAGAAARGHGLAARDPLHHRLARHLRCRMGRRGRRLLDDGQSARHRPRSRRGDRAHDRREHRGLAADHAVGHRAVRGRRDRGVRTAGRGPRGRQQLRSRGALAAAGVDHRHGRDCNVHAQPAPGRGAGPAPASARSVRRTRTRRPWCSARRGEVASRESG